MQSVNLTDLRDNIMNNELNTVILILMNEKGHHGIRNNVKH